MKFFPRLALVILAVAAILGLGNLHRSQAQEGPAWDTNALIECLNGLSADQTEPGNYLKCTLVVLDLSGNVQGVNLLNLEDCLNALSGLRPGNALKCTLVVEEPGVVDGIDTGQLQECLNRLSGRAPGLPTWEHSQCRKKALIAPPRIKIQHADVMFVMDLTGSMGGELDNVKAQMVSIINTLAGAIPDLRMGLISHEDYPDFYDSSVDPAGCDYADQYGGAGFGDEPYRLDQALTTNFPAVQAAVNAMTLKYGADGPESYARAVWELANDAGIGWRADPVVRIAVLFLDNVPHDCDLHQGLPDTTGIPQVTGIDPGRNAVIDFNVDDIDWQDDAIPAVQNFAGGPIRLIIIESNGVPSTFRDFYSYWAAQTGGVYAEINSDGTVPGGLSLAQLILDLIAQVDP